LNCAFIVILSISPSFNSYTFSTLDGQGSGIRWKEVLNIRKHDTKLESFKSKQLVGQTSQRQPASSAKTEMVIPHSHHHLPALLLDGRRSSIDIDSLTSSDNISSSTECNITRFRPAHHLAVYLDHHFALPDTFNL
jgi:hypothetical protein